MTDKPSHLLLEGVDESWDHPAGDSRSPGLGARAISASEASSVVRAASPTRGGTSPWDDRTLPLFARGPATTAPRPPTTVSPVRRGTASWDELLPVAVRHRHDALAAEAARAARPVRGGTHSWDELLAAMRAEHGAAAGAVHVSATDLVFGSHPPDPFDELPDHLLEWLTPDGAKR